MDMEEDTTGMPSLRRSKRLNGKSTASSSPSPKGKKSKPTDPQLEEMMTFGKDMMNRSEKKMGAPATEDRRFREMFGVCPEVALVAWTMMCSAGVLPEGGTLMHWLWTLCFLKVYAKQGPLSALCGGADPKTIQKWVWLFIRAFIVLEGDVIKWENRFKKDKGNDCMVTCDGTDFKIAEHGPAFSSHKYAKKSALRYEVCISILGGEIVWINGPYPCGDYPDITIFRESLLSHLAEGERVEADDGYIGEAPMYIKCPKSFTNHAETEFMQQRVRNRQETINKRFKDWGILRQLYRHEISDHGDVFRAIAMLSQLQIEKGEKLFSCGYRDPPYYTNTSYDEAEEDDGIDVEDL